MQDVEKNMNDKRDNYIPPLTFNRLTSIYDPLTRRTLREETFKRTLIRKAQIEDGSRVLDLGCGSATLTLMIKQTSPEVEIRGLDADRNILEIARGKIKKARLGIKLDQGMAYNLPYPDNSFDYVVSSLLFHHLTQENKVRAMAEAWRVLRSGGEFHLADFGKPGNILMFLISLFMRHLEEMGDNIKGLLPEMASSAGFNPVEEYAGFMTVLGTVSLVRACKP